MLPRDHCIRILLLVWGLLLSCCKRVLLLLLMLFGVVLAWLFARNQRFLLVLLSGGCTCGVATPSAGMDAGQDDCTQQIC
jgi:hypothetical protein